MLFVFSSFFSSDGTKTLTPSDRNKTVDAATLSLASYSALQYCFKAKTLDPRNYLRSTPTEHV